jgi:hypothetical protein
MRNRLVGYALVLLGLAGLRIGVLLCRAATARELDFINKITAPQRRSGLRG